jgi:hypothetical protein
VIIGSVKWRLLAWVAVVMAAGAGIGLGVDVAVAGLDKASGLAGVIVGFCELTAFALGVAAWAGRRRVASIATEEPDAVPMDTSVTEVSRLAAGTVEKRGKYVVDAPNSKGLQIGDGNIQRNDFR